MQRKQVSFSKNNNFVLISTVFMSSDTGFIHCKIPSNNVLVSEYSLTKVYWKNFLNNKNIYYLPYRKKYSSNQFHY